jgi:16S rRNA processing protein RimM
MSVEQETWVCVAAVATAHGVRGALKLRCFTERPEDVVAYGPVHDHQGNRLFKLTIVAPAKGGVIAMAEGVDDRDAAEALRGMELFVPRSALPDLEDSDEFYHSDLEGLEVVQANGVRLGIVQHVVNHGAGDLLAITGDDGKQHFIPFDRESVPVVDLAAGRVEIADRPELVADPNQASAAEVDR